MPFDTGAADQFDNGAWERSAEPFLPYVGHIGPGTALLEGGGVMAMIESPGFPFELQDTSVRNTRRRQLNTLFRAIADDNVTLGIHFVRHARRDRPHRDIPRRGFARRFFEAYERNCLCQLWHNRWFISLIVSPRMQTAGELRSRLAELPLIGPRLRRTKQASESAISQLEDATFIVLAYLRQAGARRLGLYERRAFRFSEIGEALQLILTAEYEPVPVTSGRLGSAIYANRVICGRRGIEIQPPGAPYYGRVFGFRDYPEKTITSQLSALLSAPYTCVLSQSFRFLSRSQAQSALHFKKIRMENAMDAAVSQIEELAAAQDEVARGDSVRGEHQISFTVFAPDGPALEAASADAKKRLTQAGIVPVPESRGCFAAYWSRLPGSAEWLRTRPGRISTRNLTAFGSLDGFPEGRSDGRAYWDKPIIRFRTTAGTTYDLEPHVGDVGHGTLIGKTGVGKTLFMALLAVALALVVGDGCVFLLDKDRGNEIAVRAMGGRYLPLRAGEDSGLAPLRALCDTAADRAFLAEWIEGLIRLDGGPGLLPDEQKRLARGVARVMALAPSLRSLAAIRQFLGVTDARGAGARMERWCQGGALGWVFDGEQDDLRLDATMVGVDMTRLLEHEACPAVGAYLLHRIRALLDGRRVVVMADEARFYLRDAFFAAMFEDFALTLRKQEGALFLAAQQPEHLLQSPAGPSLIAQCQTRFLFPQQSVDREAYLSGLGCTDAELKAVVEEMPALPVRTVLLKREASSVILQIELTGMEDEIAVLSGRAATVRLLDQVRAEHGDDPENWLPIFLARARDVLRRESREGEQS